MGSAPTSQPASGPETARCPLCGLDYAPGGESCRERGCPVAIGGCATRHCPRCGYTVPDEERSLAARLVRFVLGARKVRPPRTLADVEAGSSAAVEGLEGAPGLLARLTAQGLAPGVVIHVVQRLPTHVIEVGETTVAVERRVAEAILVRLL